jgi:enolase
MGEIGVCLRGRDFSTLDDIDDALIHLDGTRNKGRLGANAIIGVSMAVARAIADAEDHPLWFTLERDGVAPVMPAPHFNVVNGGLHAPNDLDFQEFMIAPIGAPSITEAVRAGAATYDALRSALSDKGLNVAVGDEGGFAPQVASPEDVLGWLVEAIDAAGYQPGPAGIAIALDPASTQFYRDGAYVVGGRRFSSDEMIEWYAELADRYPIWSIEDGLAEDDWQGWERLTARLGDRLQLVGDDLFVTNPAIIAEGIAHKAANAALIKPNQIGTVTETLQAMRVCRDAGWSQMVSHRSGETEDAFIADLAVASGCGQIKSGAPARGERVAKYNRLMEIEAQTGLPYGRSK